MNAISLWQPWASLVAERLKRWETRHWRPPLRGDVAIHAAKRWGRDQREYCVWLLKRSSGFDWHDSERILIESLAREPVLGAVVALVYLGDVEPSERLITRLDSREILLGDYGPGRFGWCLDPVRRLREPLPLRGRQGFWTLTAAEATEIRRRATA